MLGTKFFIYLLVLNILVPDYIVSLYYVPVMEQKVK